MALINPVPGSDWSNNGGYDADSGLDILVPVGTRCVAAADGVVEYAELGHTPWWEDTNLATMIFDPPHSVRIRLDTPLVEGGVTYSFIWYTHLYKVDPSILNRTNTLIRAGDSIGLTGIGNRVPHLHFGLVVDRPQTRWMKHGDIARLIWGSGSPATRPVLSRGSVGRAVRELQRTLTSTSLREDQRKFNPQGIDGDFGENTEKAVKAFQEDRDLPTNGVVDEATWNALLNTSS
jgi:murein DD-endopeptidase MepM/ murein hydrolase activator NlpD